MAKNFTYLSLVAAVLMTACTTTQLPSPYEQSSNYNNNQATTSYATHQAPTLTTASYASHQAPTYDATARAVYSCPVGTSSQPNGTCLVTESSVNRQASVINAGQTSGHQTTRHTQYEAVPRTANVIKANSVMTPPTQIIPQVTRNYGGSIYQVEAGDTVYSLARRRCVTVDDIKNSNGLNGDYGIQAGQTLQLPPSHC